MLARIASILVCFVSFSLATQSARAQAEPSPNDSVRVSVIVNEDGSSTAYKVDAPNHKAVATTTESGGKARGKIEYLLDDAGRFASGKVYSADGKFLFKTAYKYDATGHLLEEDRFGKNDQSVGKIVYEYNAEGRQTGYSVLDGNGKVIGRTTPPKPTPKPKSRR